MLIDSDLVAGEILNQVERYPTVTFDVETSGLKLHKQDRIVGVALGVSHTEGWYLPFRHGEGANLSPETYQKLAKCLQGKTLRAFNAQFDVTAWMRDGFSPPPTIRDPMLAAHLMNESETSYQLKVLSDKYLGANSSAADKEVKALLKEAGFKDKGDLWRLPAAKVARYATDDVLLTHRLDDFYAPLLERWKLTDLYATVCGYEQVIQKLHYRGLQLDVDRTRELLAEALLQVGITKQQMQEMSGRADLNPNSSKQLQEWLQMKSTAKKLIEKLADGRDDIAKLLDYRAWGKVAGTYYESFLEEMDNDGVLHPNLHLVRTPARLSSSNPNLQALPRQLDAKDSRSRIYKVKDSIVARPGRTLIELDFSQAEVRMAAWVSGDPALKAAMSSGKDIYTAIAEQAGIDRQAAKTVTLAKIYRAGIKRLTEQINTKREDMFSESDTKRVVGMFDSVYLQLAAFSKKLEFSARKRGYIRTWSGRVRRYTNENIEDDDPRINYKQSRARPYRSFNNLCQISAADMTMTAMLAIDRELGDRAPMVLQVHDSIAVEALDEDALEIAQACKAIMERPPPGCEVPIVADVKMGKRWSELKKMEAK